MVGDCQLKTSLQDEEFAVVLVWDGRDQQADGGLLSRLT